MIAVERTALILLAAGRSVRFGEGGSKLDQPLRGRPLGLHAAATLAGLMFQARIAVIGGGVRIDYAAHGFGIVRNPDSGAGLASSIGLGVAAADETGADAVLIALADMPCITVAHVRRLFAAAGGNAGAVASSDGDTFGPPAIFGQRHFAALRSLQGDSGARALLRAGRHVVARAAELIDIDTPDELAALHRAPCGGNGRPTPEAPRG